ncbi:extracellular solute-binding protein [Nostoc sp. ChiVER01]|uniref:extracellular solute-binding protein n=1 Tax=Nostoc sp. ChiVER01 TaxID=3075382 RepID=UPI002AD1E439|nr:extracellular solute-binding protein [Nostoc sp. ChiVER01]MDZ8226428.1 extracellular solute-binding protein [Nostoc sp. ChiVER01]
MSIQLISGCSSQPVPLSFIVKDDETEVWNPLIAQFNAKHPNIIIRPDVLKQDSRKGTDRSKEALISAFTDKDKKPYDLLYLDIIWVPEFVEQGWLKDLTKEFPPKDLKKEFLFSEVDNGCYGGKKGCDDGKLYRVPFRTDIGLLYYRKDLLAKIQAKPPETFDDLKKIVKRYQTNEPKLDKNFWGYLWQGQGEALVAMFTEVLHGYGGYWIKKDWIRKEKVVDHDEQCQGNNPKQPDKCKVVGLDEPQAIQAVQFLYDTIYDSKISPSDLLSFTDPDTDILKIFLAEPDAVFMRNWPFTWAKAYEAEPKFSGNGKIDFIPMVHAEGNTSGASKGGWGFGVAEKTKYPHEAIEAIRFFSSAAIQRQFALNYSSLPSRRRLFFDPQIVARYRHYPKLLALIDRKEKKDEWIARPRIPQYTKASCILQKYLRKALNPSNGYLPPDKAMGEAAQKTRELLDRETQKLSPQEMLKC